MNSNKGPVMTLPVHGEPGPDLDERRVLALAQTLRHNDFSDDGNARLLSAFDPSHPNDQRYMRMARSALRMIR